MILTPHAVVGVAIATLIPNPYIAVPTAFFLHFAEDLIPHWDYDRVKKNGELDKYYPLKVMADLSLGIAFGLSFTLYALFKLNNPALATNIFLCGVFSAVPDLIMAPILFNPDVQGIPRKMYKIQSKLHFHMPLPWGLISQIVVSGVCLFLILSSKALL
jgi:hypothetical protein